MNILSTNYRLSSCCMLLYPIGATTKTITVLSSAYLSGNQGTPPFQLRERDRQQAITSTIRSGYETLSMPLFWWGLRAGTGDSSGVALNGGEGLGGRLAWKSLKTIRLTRDNWEWKIILSSCEWLEQAYSVKLLGG